MILNNKRGIVFTIVSLVISGFVLVMFFYLMERPIDEDVDLTRLKINRANTFLDQVDDITKAYAITNSRIIINGFIKDMYDTENYINNFDDRFISCLENGTLCPSNVNVNFKEAVENDLSIAVNENLGLPNTIIVDNISFEQSSPWELNVSFELFVEVYMDESRDSYWNISSNVSGIFSIIGFKDPIQAASNNDLRPTFENLDVYSFHKNYRNITDEWLETPSTLNDISKNKSYFEDSEFGVSFLNRIRGNLITDSMGVLRVVLPFRNNFNNEPINQGYSNVDWHFWGNTGSGARGIYEFTETDDIMQVLAFYTVEPSYDLNDTLHEVIIPRALATKAKVDGSSYFKNYP